MSRWRKRFLEEVSTRIGQLGLSQCPVCGTEGLTVNRWPTIESIGGSRPLTADDADQEVNILFLVHVECPVCGHVLLFNSERFRGGNTQVLIRGLTEEEEAELERTDPWQ